MSVFSFVFDLPVLLTGGGIGHSVEVFIVFTSYRGYECIYQRCMTPSDTGAASGDAVTNL